MRAGRLSCAFLLFPRNSQPVAIAAGIDYSGCTRDRDGSNSRSAASSAISSIAGAAHDFVWARDRPDESALRSYGCDVLCRVRRFAIPLIRRRPAASADFTLCDAFSQCQERNRLTCIDRLERFRETSVPYHRRALVGSLLDRSEYAEAAMPFISFSRCIRTISFLGLLVSGLSFVFGVYVFINQIFFGTRVMGWTSVMLAVLVLGGVQLLMIGVLGEYLQRILDEARGRPLYTVERAPGPSPTVLSQPEGAASAARGAPFP